MDSDELAELVRSIRDHGLLNPILVRRAGKTYQVISGHRRLAAYPRLQFAAKSDEEKRNGPPSRRES
jgi:ParB/RepB/Spo0J family partition protein